MYTSYNIINMLKMMLPKYHDCFLKSNNPTEIEDRPSGIQHQTTASLAASTMALTDSGYTHVSILQPLVRKNLVFPPN